MLYTRKGDAGTTKALDSKERISKSSSLPEALGTLDELNSFLGMTRSSLARLGDFTVPFKKTKCSAITIVCLVQEHLFIIQAQLAGSDKKLLKTKVIWLEKLTDAMEAHMPPLKGFSVPGATEQSALFDVARTLARRAERRVVGVCEEGVRVMPTASMMYLNRLSSLLFALARFANAQAKIVESIPTYK
jgi:cob(I)alamin adenosyltransferase